MYKDIVYKSNCINKVILRIDFYGILEDDLIFDTEFITAVAKYFPQREADRIVPNVNIQLNSSGAIINEKVRDKLIQKKFLDSFTHNAFTIDNRSLAYEINNFKSFEDINSKFSILFSTLMDLAKEKRTKIVIARIGLRYINIFNSTNIKPQKNYFKIDYDNPKNFIGNSTKAEFVPDLSRSLITNEYMYEDLRINFRFGLYNPHYPAPLKDDSILLDIDAVYQGASEDKDSILTKIITSHDVIQYLFEEVITDKLREKLGI